MTEQQPIPPVKLAFVLDGKVQDVLHTDDRLAAIFLSEPIIVDVTEVMRLIAAEDPRTTIVGWDYDGKSFTPPKEEVEE